MVKFFSKRTASARVLSRAQGTIEYLLIIGVVVTISLVVAGISTNILDTQQVSSTSEDIGLRTSVLGVSEIVVGGDTNGLVVVKNNDSTFILLEKIILDDVDHNYGVVRLNSGQSASFLLRNLVACSSGKQVFDLKIRYLSRYGLEKTINYGKVSFDCIPTINPVGSYYDENNGTVTLLEKFIYLYLNSDFASGTFNYAQLKGTDVGVEMDVNKIKLSSGLVGLWNFNGNALDSSENGNNGTVSGATLTTDRFGVANKAYSFDGVNDTISVPDSSVLDLTNQLTISAWIYPTKASGIQNVISKSSSSQNNAYIFPRTENGWSQISYLASINGWKTIFVSFPSRNVWHHVVGTYDGVTMKTYIDGVAIGSTTYSGTILTNSNPLVFGNQPGFSEYYGGTLDEVAVWDRNLGASEVLALYNSTEDLIVATDSNYLSPVIDTGATDTNFVSMKFNTTNKIIYGGELNPSIETDYNTDLVGLWHFNEASGTTAIDSSERGHMGLM
ncbi:MAG: LamG domain-containing protein [archaeon]|jgi:hypothetical protein